jgi:hypothetical protein
MCSLDLENWYNPSLADVPAFSSLPLAESSGIRQTNHHPAIAILRLAYILKKIRIYGCRVDDF